VNEGENYVRANERGLCHGEGWIRLETRYLEPRGGEQMCALAPVSVHQVRKVIQESGFRCRCVVYVHACAWYRCG